MDDDTALAPYGPWVSGLDREAAVDALIAIGLVAARSPAFAFLDDPDEIRTTVRAGH